MVETHKEGVKDKLMIRRAMEQRFMMVTEYVVDMHERR